MRNYFILNGVDSRDYGVYISGQGTFSAPQKAYKFYNVPGRNGALLGNEHRLENINVSYEAFIYADFDNNMAKFRSFLLSLNGYKRLTDSYHPDEYRMAAYVGPFEPKVQRTNDAGSFTITFSCKPQRWLLSGDTTYSWAAGGEQTITGSTLNVYGPRLDTSFLNWEWSVNNTTWIQQIPGSSPAIYVYDVSPTNPKALSQLSSMDMRFDGTKVYEASFYACSACEVNLITGAGTRTRSVTAIPTTSWNLYAQNVFRHSFSIYSSINGSSHFSKATDLSVLTNSNAGYGFYFDGSYLYIKHKDYSTASDFMTWLAKANPTMDITLATTASFSVTPYVPNYPDGFFALSSSASGITFELKYTDGDNMSNPTAFPSQPLIRVYGNGVFVMDGITITVTNATEYTDIDCEIMDCYEGSTNRNKDVTFSTYDFPKLQPGENAVSIVSGITFVMIQPRWWQV